MEQVHPIGAPSAWYLQKHYSASHVAEVPLRLRPPLRLEWSLSDGLDHPIVSEAVVCARVLDLDGVSWLVAVDHEGTEIWRRAEQYSGLSMVGHALIGTVEKGTHKALSVLDAKSGQQIRREESQFAIALLIPGSTDFLGLNIVNHSREESSVVLVRGSMDPLQPVRWARNSRGARAGHSSAKVFDFEPTYASERVFIGCGDEFLCLDAADGRDVWSTPLRSPGLCAWCAVVAGDVVLVGTRDGTVGMDVQSGRVLWRSTRVGPFFVRDGMVYLVSPEGLYCTIEAQSGRRLLERRVDALMTGLCSRPVQLATRIVTSDSHAFVGDSDGRVWAIERHSGEPVWWTQPDDTVGFFGGVPIVAGERLYISSAASDYRKRTHLYCFGEASGGRRVLATASRADGERPKRLPSW